MGAHRYLKAYSPFYWANILIGVLKILVRRDVLPYETSAKLLRFGCEGVSKRFLEEVEGAI